VDGRRKGAPRPDDGRRSDQRTGVRARSRKLRSLDRFARRRVHARVTDLARIHAPGGPVQKSTDSCAASAVKGYLRECRRCGTGFGICRPCDRGRRYCSVRCAMAQRAEWIRVHRATQRVTFKGRRARAARNLRWRSKKAAQKETDQSLSQPGPIGQGVGARPVDAPAREEHANGSDAAGAKADGDSSPAGQHAASVGSDDDADVATGPIEPAGDDSALLAERRPQSSAPFRCVRCGCIIDEVVPEEPVLNQEHEPRASVGPGLARAGPLGARRSRGHG
jgi:hypothetical protein